MIEVAVRSSSGPIVALIDDEDRDLVEGFAWHLGGGNRAGGEYAQTGVKIYGQRRTHFMHRLVAWAMGLVPAPIDGTGPRWTHSVDHINGDKLDNRRCNLRFRSRADQMRNPNDRNRSTNRSGHRGVSFVKLRQRYGKPWMAYVTVDYRTINLGWFETVEEAAAARRAWDEQHP